LKIIFAAVVTPSLCFGEVKNIELAELIKLTLIDSSSKSSFHSYMTINNKIGPLKQITIDAASKTLKSTYEKYNALNYYKNQYIVNYNNRALAIKDISSAAEWDIILIGSKATPSHLIIQTDHYSVEDFVPNIKYFAKYGITLEPLICSIQSGHALNNTAYYKVKSKNKENALMVIESSSGSAGNSFTFEITWAAWDLREIIKSESSSLEHSYPISVGLCEVSN